jgi:fructoselysine 6-kinase
VAVSVACVGDNCVDRYVDPPGLTQPGGNALNVAVHVAAAAVASAYLGIVADDADGRLLLVAARAADVDVDGVEVRRDGHTGVTIVRHADGDRIFESEDYGVAADIRLAGPVLERAARHEWVHVTRVPAAAAGLAALRERGVRTSYDLGENPGIDLVTAVCPHLDVAFVSAPSAAAAAVANVLLAAGARTAVVTRGAGGALAADGSGIVEQPAEDVDVLDTLGAGDALIGAYIAAAVGGGDAAAALAAGSRAAARTCTHVGAWPTIDARREAS